MHKERYGSTLETIGMLSQVGPMTKVFQRIDGDESGSIEILELLDYCNVDRTPFIERCFRVMDMDGGGSMDFREFCFMVWNFCTMDLKGLGFFLFDCYDVNGSGRMDAGELQRALRDTYGAKAEQTRVMRAVARVQSDPSGGLTRSAFADMCMNSQDLLYAALHSQRQVQRAILGTSTWQAKTLARSESSDSRLHPAAWQALQLFLLGQDLQHQAARNKLERQSTAKVREDREVRHAEREAVLRGGAVADPRPHGGASLATAEMLGL